MKAAELVYNFESSVMKIAAKNAISNIDREYYEFSRKDLLEYITRLECLVESLLAEASKLGITSAGWDTKVSEYRHWDL